MIILAGNYIFKVNNRSTRTRCEVSSKLTIMTPERCPERCRRSGVFTVVRNNVVLVSLLLT